MSERAGKLYQNGIETNIAAIELRMFFKKDSAPERIRRFCMSLTA